ncbi:hypothetical protein F7725_005336 [Dissostichus mawsoni]|uniref:Tesmin/TSO1-like CXC domain-containing protein n=1 Tax=Dissostichus mawsoni TaxID=36200 RepID=A0A7J5YSS6_DISMA|nr:hypothetical protein F7725_005336 [Dissostichus mawsoni]
MLNILCLQHVKRAVFQAGHIWGQSQIANPELPSPADWGWAKNADDFWHPFWTVMPEASKGCRELIKCKCKKRCAGNCKCSAANLPCTELCSCSGQCFQDEHAAKHYRLCMHVFGLMTQATTLKELDQVVVSATVLLASPCSGENVDKHFKDLQTLLTAVAQPVIDDSGIAEEDFVLDASMAGDLGRHGRGPFYEKLSKRFKRVAQKSTQNYTKDNMTQWDLKKIRFQQKRLTRLDDFVHTYKVMHNALLREYQDSLKTKNKTHRVDVERWKQRKQRRRGVYVTPITKPFDFKKSKAKKVKERRFSTHLCPRPTSKRHRKNTRQLSTAHTTQLKSPHQSTSVITDAHEQKPSPEHVTSQCDTEGTDLSSVSVVEDAPPLLFSSENVNLDSSAGRSMHQVKTLSVELSETVKVIEGLFHLYASQFNTGNTIYILNHYTAGILFGQRTSSVGTACQSIFGGSSGKFQRESRLGKCCEKSTTIPQCVLQREYFKMRRTCYGKEDWGTVKWRGATMHHPVQRDGSSCGCLTWRTTVQCALPQSPQDLGLPLQIGAN